MLTLTELRETYFADRPITQIFYGEPLKRRVIEAALRDCKIPLIEDAGLDADVWRRLTIGYCPVLIESYDGFVFDRDVRADELRDYLRERLNRPKPRTVTSLVPKPDVHISVFTQFMARIRRRPHKFRREDRSIKLYFLAEAGERLVIATMGHAPVPGEAIYA